MRWQSFCHVAEDALDAQRVGCHGGGLFYRACVGMAQDDDEEVKLKYDVAVVCNYGS